jgi:antitoxin component HigA of HigAB toxin-antitoxin module
MPPIHHRRYLSRIEALLDQKKRSAAEDRLLELLSILAERYEDEHERIGVADPVGALKALILREASLRRTWAEPIYR